MGKRKRPTYTKEFKAEAVELALKVDKSIADTARDIGISESGLRRWIEQAQIDSGDNPTEALTSTERQELNRIRRELRQVKMERDFLKKVATFFAREDS